MNTKGKQYIRKYYNYTINKLKPTQEEVLHYYVLLPLEIIFFWHFP